MPACPALTHDFHNSGVLSDHRTAALTQRKHQKLIKLCHIVVYEWHCHTDGYTWELRW